MGQGEVEAPGCPARGEMPGGLTPILLRRKRLSEGSVIENSPLGTTVAISERAAVAALTLVPGLQKRQYALVPRRLDEKAFWVNFFSHATCLLAPKK